MTLEGYNGSEHSLLSYDVATVVRHRAAMVCHIVFGRWRRTEAGERIEPGFVHRPGVVWIGQSVLVMPPKDADELAPELRALDVRVTVASIAIAPMALRAFRRQGLAHGFG